MISRTNIDPKELKAGKVTCGICGGKGIQKKYFFLTCFKDLLKQVEKMEQRED